jgi:alkanesulfonate monooxygenase SsuD/methylene tetrahydromethanopterin reductase-like flavin-dependent oxidoreductase (luciferase family)
MWTQERATVEGRYYHIRGAINEPKPIQRPHPQLWIGGGGDKVTLKLVAQYGDASNFGGGPREVRHKLGVLREHCQAVGRDYGEILKTTIVSVHRGERPEAVAVQLGVLAQAGIQYFTVYLAGAAEGGRFQRFAEQVIPLVREKAAA